MLAGTHVPNRRWPLAVTRKTGSRECVHGHPLDAAGQQGLAHAGPAEDALERADMEILARVRRRHERDLGRAQVEGRLAAGLQQRYQPEWLDRRSERHEMVWIADAADDPALRIHLHDVAAVFALHDPVPDLANEDGRDDGCRPAG